MKLGLEFCVQFNLVAIGSSVAGQKESGEFRMKGPTLANSLAVAVAATAMVIGTSASAAARTVALDPLVSLSVLGTQGSRAAVCAAGSAAASAAASAAQTLPGTGCVLPVTDVPPPPPVAQNAPAPVATGAVLPAASAGLGLVPALVLLGALGAAVWALADGDGDDNFVNLPISIP